MVSPVAWFNNIFLKKYNEDTDFVLYKKAQFIASLSSALALIMVLLLGVSLSTSREVFLTAYKPASTLILILIMAITLVVKGRVLWSANLIAVASLLIEIFAFTSRPPHLATVTIGLFFYQTVVFATLFCRAYISIPILAAIVTTHIYYFVMVVSKTVQGPALDAGRMAAIDGSITLITVFLICLALSRFLLKAIEKANNQSKKNLEQYQDIRNMMETIQSTSELLGKSIIDTSAEIGTISDNAQSQAAAVEELSAAMEEISAGTVNVSYSSREQGDAIHNLVETLEKLSSLIENLEVNGREISNTFLALMQKATEGEKSTGRLDQINTMISSNSNEILSVVNIMTDIFDKVNLLSLNAAIEAARAGEHGKGFAVVASEIGKLAENSSREANQISKLIEKNKSDVEAGNRAISEIITFVHSLVSDINGIQGKAVDVLHAIHDQKLMNEDMNSKTRTVKNKTDQISTAMMEQEKAVDNIVSTIADTTDAIQGIAGSIDNLRINSEGLKKLADDLGRRFARE